MIIGQIIVMIAGTIWTVFWIPECNGILDYIIYFLVIGLIAVITGFTVPAAIDYITRPKLLIIGRRKGKCLK